MSQRPFEDLRILKVVPENFFKLREGVFLFFVHAAMLLRPSHHLPNPGKPDVDLFTVSTGPVHPSAAAAAAEPFGCIQDVWWDCIGDLFGGHILEDTVAIAAARPFEILWWRKLMPLEHLGELSLEDARVHHLGLRPNRRELSIPGQQPPTFASCDPGELGILRLGSEVEAIVATEAKPASEGAEHGVAKESRNGGRLAQGETRISQTACSVL